MVSGYKFLGVNTAIDLLRPGAKYQLENNNITQWWHKDPPPTWDEIEWMMGKIKEFEDISSKKEE
jgi:hypothetical protein